MCELAAITRRSFTKSMDIDHWNLDRVTHCVSSGMSLTAWK
jgi:hypothetical protein